MSNRKLGILAVVAAGMILLAMITARTSVSGRTKTSGPAYLIQGLDPANIHSLVIGHGKDEIKIERQENQFVIVNKSGYPADPKQINDLITKALDIKTVELFTSDPKNHEDLEVTEEKARNVVKFFKADGSLLTGVIIGKSLESGQGAYVRLASGNEVYLATETPWFRTRAVEYVNQEIASVKREDIRVVTVTSPEGSYTLRTEKAGSDVVVMDNLPADKKLKDSDAKSVLTALQGLRFDDVNAPAQIEGLAFDRKYVARLEDSTEYTLELAKKGDKTYLKVRAVYTNPDKVTINPNQQDSPEELKKKEAILLAQENAQRFALRHKDWVYEIPDWKANYLMKAQADLLEAKEKPAEVKVETPADGSAPVIAPGPAITLPPVVPSQPAATPPAAEPNKTQ